MTFLLRNLLPFTYFQFSRLNKWKYVVYHFILEWLPAIFLALYYNNFAPQVLTTLFLNYLAFICIYEIGYLTNDFFSEKFEDAPRGRMSNFSGGQTIIWILIIFRLCVFVFLTFFLNVQTNTFWWLFFGSMLATFIFHNLRLRDYRISSFFSLSVFRFIAPLILCLPPEIVKMLFGVIMLNYSLFRTITYIENKNIVELPQKNETNFKLFYFINCFPLGFVLSFYFDSFVPIIFCIYYMVMWLFYGILVKK